MPDQKTYHPIFFLPLISQIRTVLVWINHFLLQDLIIEDSLLDKSYTQHHQLQKNSIFDTVSCNSFHLPNDLFLYMLLSCIHFLFSITKPGQMFFYIWFKLSVLVIFCKHHLSKTEWMFWPILILSCPSIFPSSVNVFSDFHFLFYENVFNLTCYSVYFIC